MLELVMAGYAVWAAIPRTGNHRVIVRTTNMAFRGISPQIQVSKLIFTHRVHFPVRQEITVQENMPLHSSMLY